MSEANPILGVVFVAAARLWLMLLVAAVAGAYVVAQLRTPRFTLRFTQLDLLDTVAPRRPRWRKHIVAALTVLGMTVLVLAAARPHVTAPVAAEQAAVLVTLDTSLSMEAVDVPPNRFDVARAAATRFVEGIPQPVQVGLVSFNGTVTVEVAPTSDRDRVVAAVEGLTLGESTAIGDAIAVSVDALIAADITGSAARVVLLSDGGNTVGRPVADGIAVALDAEVPISTIAYGTPFGTVTYQGQVVPVPVDGPTLQQVADATGGTYYTAASGDDLADVYADIGSTITVEEQLAEITDRFVLVGLALLLLGAGASLLWFNRIP